MTHGDGDILDGRQGKLRDGIDITTMAKKRRPLFKRASPTRIALLRADSVGSGGWIRTSDQLINSHALMPVSIGRRQTSCPNLAQTHAFINVSAVER